MSYLRILQWLFAIITMSRAAILTEYPPLSYIKECQPIYGYKSQEHYLVVTQCPMENTSMDLISKCHNPMRTTIGKIPVTNIEQGITFRNIFCALCYQQYNEIMRWRLSMQCDTGVIIKDHTDLDSLSGCQTTVSKPRNVKLTQCEPSAKARKRRQSNQFNSLTANLGYSTLLNFGVDGRTNIVLTSDMDEFLSKTQCKEANLIFNPFNQQCIRINCPASHISYNGECMEPASYMKETKKLCIDYQIAYGYNESFRTDLTSLTVKQAITKFLQHDFNIPPENVRFPANMLNNSSMCSKTSTDDPTQMFWKAIDFSADETNRNNTAWLVARFAGNNLPPHEHNRSSNKSNNDTSYAYGDTYISLKYSYRNTNVIDLEQLKDPEKIKGKPLVIDYANTTAGYLVVTSMNVSADDVEWCRGMKNEYKNDEFFVLHEEEKIIGVTINATNKTYHLSQFQLTTVISGTFWGNIKRIVSTCDRFPEIADKTCPKIAVAPSEYEILSNGSLYVKPFDELSEMQLPFDDDPRSPIKAVFDTDEYQYVTNNTDSALQDAQLANPENLTASVCLPTELLALLIEVNIWNKVQFGKSCAYLQQFGFGSTVAGLVCSGLSLIAMVLVLITYSLFKTMRTMPGVSLMHLTVAIMLSQLTFIAGLFTPADIQQTDYGCFSIAVITHYCILASLMWMNVMAYSSYRAFGANLKTRLLQLSRRHLIVNSLYGWGLPAVIVLVCVIIDYVMKEEQLIAYGTVTAIHVFEERNSTGTLENIQIKYRTLSSCWIGNSKAALIIFGLPLVYSMVINLGLFIRTCWGMRRKDGRPKAVLRRDSGSGHMKQRNEMSIHIRLSAQYGFAWLFAIVIILLGTSKTESETLCYILYILNLLFNILHGCTGLFIFIAFICNRRILHLYKSKLVKQGLNRNRSSNSVYQISSTRLNPSLCTSTSYASSHSQMYTPPDSPLEASPNLPDG